MLVTGVNHEDFDNIKKNLLEKGGEKSTKFCALKEL